MEFIERKRPGRPPKAPEDRARNRVDLPSPRTAIKLPPWDGKTRGPSLGKYNNEGLTWHKKTLSWWRIWRQSPQAMFMEPTDWENLFLAAVLYDRIMKGASSTALSALAGEVRKITGQVGASIEDRVRLGMSSDTGLKEIEESEIQKGVEEAVDYAARIGAALGKEIDDST